MLLHVMDMRSKIPTVPGSADSQWEDPTMKTALIIEDQPSNIQIFCLLLTLKARLQSPRSDYGQGSHRSGEPRDRTY